MDSGDIGYPLYLSQRPRQPESDLTTHLQNTSIRKAGMLKTK